MSGAFTVRGGIVCDYVRREDTGKLILIGVYAHNIVVEKFPANLVLACIIMADAEKLGTLETEFQVLLDGKKIASGTGRVGFEELGMAYLPIPNIVLGDLKGPGTLCFQVREQNANWQTIVELPLDSR